MKASTSLTRPRPTASANRSSSFSAALRGVARERVVISTKGGLRLTPAGLVRDASAAWIRAGVDASLRALGTDYVDLYQLHWPDPTTPLSETAETLAKLIAEGKIRHVGVANFDVEQLEALEIAFPVETLQPPLQPVSP